MQESFVRNLVNYTCAAAAALSLSCGSPAEPSKIPPQQPAPQSSPTPAPTPAPKPPQQRPYTLVEFAGAGDICETPFIENARSTGRLLSMVNGRIFTLGDNQYDNATAEEFSVCYAKTEWGNNKYRTAPTPGNHEYQRLRDASGYFGYFGNSAAPPDGYYSFEYGDWLIIALNTNPEIDLTSEKVWLEGILTDFQQRRSNTSPAPCALAYGHHPRFTSGPNRDITQMEDFYRILREHSVEILISAHNHQYERFQRHDPNGSIAEDAPMQLVAGTGGHHLLYEFPFVQPNSVIRLREYGILKLRLMTGGYEGQFIATSGLALDNFSGTCY